MGMTSTNATNDIFDIYNIPSTTTQRIFMGLWCAITFSSAFVGNLAVLYASIKHDAIKLDRISTILIKNIALADIGYSFYIMITLITIVNDTWIFGDVMCNVINYMHLFFAISEIYLICALNVSKLHVLLFPLQARVRSAKSGYILAIIMWSVQPVLHLIPTVIMKRIQSFRLTFYTCEGYFVGSSKLTQVFPAIAAMLFAMLPMLVVIIAVIWILHYVRRVQGLQKQSIFTLLFISLCYICSYLPYGAYYILKVVISDIDTNVPISVHYYRFAVYVMYFNFSINPMIYIFTVKSYQEFLRGALTSTKKSVSDAKFSVASKIISLYSTTNSASQQASHPVSANNANVDTQE